MYPLLGFCLYASQQRLILSLSFKMVNVDRRERKKGEKSYSDTSLT